MIRENCFVPNEYVLLCTCKVFSSSAFELKFVTVQSASKYHIKIICTTMLKNADIFRH